jgi:hypothetical protein
MPAEAGLPQTTKIGRQIAAKCDTDTAYTNVLGCFASLSPYRDCVQVVRGNYICERRSQVAVVLLSYCPRTIIR